MAAPHLAIDERFVAQCAPAIGTNYDTCGTVTRAEIDHLTKTDLENLFKPGGFFADMDAWFKHSIEMKACGTRTYALYEWIMANAERSQFKAAMTATKAVKGPSLLHPFIFGRQDSVVNKDYWTVSSGRAINSVPGTEGIDSAAGLGVTPATTAAKTTEITLAQITTALTDTGFKNMDGTTPDEEDVVILRITSRQGVPYDKNFFRQRDEINVFAKSGGSASLHGIYRTLVAVSTTATDTTTFMDVAALPANPSGYQAAPTITTSAAIVAGVIIPGINNVNNFEKWCQNLPTFDPRKRVPFWIQTYRTARCVDSEYKAVFQRLFDSNPAFREFGDLPLAERNRQDELEMQKRFVNAFFFNKPASNNQTLTAWESLETISTLDGQGLALGLSGKIMAKRANFVGVKEQLNQCGRAYDLAGATLQLFDFWDLNYRIMRARQSQGRKVDSLDWFTNSDFRELFQQSYIDYQIRRFGGTPGTDPGPVRINAELNKANMLGMTYDSYKAPKSGIDVNIISDEFFDDFYSEFSVQSDTTRGNLLVCLDIGSPGPNGGTIYWAMTGSTRKVYNSATIDELARYDSTFRCVMEYVSVEQSLMSMQGTAVVECPQNSYWIENFAMTKPVSTLVTASQFGEPNYTQAGTTSITRLSDQP